MSPCLAGAEAVESGLPGVRDPAGRALGAGNGRDGRCHRLFH